MFDNGAPVFESSLLRSVASSMSQVFSSDMSLQKQANLSQPFPPLALQYDLGLKVLKHNHNLLHWKDLYLIGVRQLCTRWQQSSSSQEIDRKLIMSRHRQ